MIKYFNNYIAIYKLTIYIYKLAKLIGKSSEIQTHNYRQL